MQTGDKTLFFWQGDRLITECHAEDANFHPSVVRNEHDKAENYRCRSYIYAPDGHGFSPLAQLNGRGRGGQIYYYFNDQLGTPQELVTINGDIVWSAVYKSYGNLAVEYQSVPQPIRLPGQYFDEESGLHYNRYRYYDPYSARYFSQDPAGLEGGENAYSYVPDPLTWIDPLGLNGCPGTQKWSVDPTTQAADKAAGVLVDGAYKKNPTAQNLTSLLTDTGRIGSKKMNGQFMYVIDQKGNVIIGTRSGERMPHPTLVGGKDPQVLSAGIVDVRAGKIYSIDNASGHYKPGTGSLDAAKDAFGKLPEKYFSKDFQGYKPYDK